MDIKIVKQLADLMEEKSLASLEYSTGDTSIHLVKAVASTPSNLNQPITVQPLPVAQTVEPPAVTAPVQPEVTTVAGDPLESPLVGIGYMASSPEEKPFVTVGSRVKKGQTLCIIEAMKVMNEFIAPRGGEIAEVCFKDGQLVEYGQPLFRLV